MSAVILPFVRPARDRIDALAWADAARAAGYTRIAFDNSARDDEPELGDFLLIYARDAHWAAWGIGCCDGGFILWRPSDGATVSWHATLRAALAAIPPA